MKFTARVATFQDYMTTTGSRLRTDKVIDRESVNFFVRHFLGLFHFQKNTLFVVDAKSPEPVVGFKRRTAVWRPDYSFRLNGRRNDPWTTQLDAAARINPSFSNFKYNSLQTHASVAA